MITTFMILSDRDIKSEIKKGNIIIKPYPDFKTQLSCCSIDLRLFNEFCVLEYSKLPYLDPYNKKQKIPVRKITIKKDGFFVLQPGAFVLGSTIEYVEIPDYLVGRVEGRSSLGRLGIVIHSTAAIFDPGWRGQLTLELANIGLMPIALYPGMRICALSFEKLSSPAEVPYYKKKNAKYLNQKGPTVSRIKLDP